MHPNNQSFVSGGQDSLIAEWDMYELMCSGTTATNDFQVRKLAFNCSGDMLAASYYDEINKKGQIEVFYQKSKQLIGGPIESISERKAIAWHP